MLINGINYSWGDISVMLFGNTPLIGIKSINYSETQDKDNNYGANNFPIGQGNGQFKYAGDMDIYREEMATIIDLAPLNKIQLIAPFDIKVVYGNNTQALKIDTLKSCQFMDNVFASKAGDKSMVNKVKLLIGFIQWGQ